jgi:hypothetical protein
MAMKRTKRQQSVLKLLVKGPAIGQGRIPIPDLLRVCGQVQAAINRQAEALEGETTLRAGPVLSRVKDECTLDLLGISKASSAMLRFSFSKPQIPLPYPDAQSPGNAAIVEVAAAIKSLGNGGKKRHIDPGVLESLNDLGLLLDQGTVSEIHFIVPQRGKKRRIFARFNNAARRGVQARRKEPQIKTYTVEGILDMADFKIGDLKCRIDPPIGQSVVCTFAPDREDEIYEAMRRPVRVRGLATRDPHSDRIDKVEIQEFEIIQPIAVGEAEFFAARTFKELAERQGAKPLSDPKALEGVFSEADNLDEMLEEIYQGRT